MKDQIDKQFESVMDRLRKRAENAEKKVVLPENDFPQNENLGVIPDNTKIEPEPDNFGFPKPEVQSDASKWQAIKSVLASGEQAYVDGENTKSEWLSMLREIKRFVPDTYSRQRSIIADEIEQLHAKV